MRPSRSDTVETPAYRRRTTELTEPLEDRAQLIVLVGSGAGRSYLVDRELTIGRGPDSDVSISSNDVSRRHARISPDHGRFLIEDLGSTNGTVVNGVPVTAQILAFGDKIRIGSRTLLLLTRYDRLEDRLLRSQRLETLGQIAGGVAHDFNNILGAGIANIEYLLGLPEATPMGEEEVRDCLADLGTGARRAADLTRRLLGLVRPHGTTGQWLPLAEAVRDEVAMLRRTLLCPVALDVKVRDNLCVPLEPVQLNQVLTNLLINARDAMPDGGTITVTVRRVDLDSGEAGADDNDDDGGDGDDASDDDDEGGGGNGDLLDGLSPGAYVHLEVADTGTGMDEAAVRNAFEPFFTTKSPGQGTGLGLSTVLSIVRGHGGTAGIRSRPGQGTSVHVCLPCRELETPHAVVPAEPKLPPTRKLNAALVLLVDDEAIVRRAVARTLDGLGHPVITAEDGVQAVRLFAEHRDLIQLVMLDLNMPNMDGIEAHRRIRDIDPDARILLISGDAQRNGVEALRGAGHTAFLPKPFDRDDLSRAVADLLLET